MELITLNDIKDVTIDTTVQEKSITYPTDCKLFHKVREHLVELAKEYNVKLRQTYSTASKQSLLKQFYSKSSKNSSKIKEQRKIKNYLGRVIRDITRKYKSEEDWKTRCIYS